MNNPRLLHIYGQGYPHAEALIWGTRDALESLRLQIERALNDGQFNAADPYFVDDGEGFTLQVRCVSEEEMGQSVVPYCDPIFQEESQKWPYKVGYEIIV